jgi:hypothetical protein
VSPTLRTRPPSSGPHRWLVVIRRDDELAAYDLDRLLAGDDAPAARFPAPWPRRAGGIDAVSPTLDLAVFSGQHALHAVDAAGVLSNLFDYLWEVTPALARGFAGQKPHWLEGVDEHFGRDDHFADLTQSAPTCKAGVAVTVRTAALRIRWHRCPTRRMTDKGADGRGHLVGCVARAPARAIGPRGRTAVSKQQHWLRRWAR